jgi:inosine-uridine nucleoside N-ribohydrolase
MQFQAQAKPPVGFIFDCDMGNRIDDALALALLYGFDGKREARVVSVSITKSNVKAAAFCEVMGRFYGGSVSGAFFAFARTLPVGMAEDNRMSEDTAMITAPLSRKNEKGEPVYPHGIDQVSDTAEPHALIRNALTAQHDQNAIILLTGPATNIVRAMALPGVPDLIARKVRYVVISAGSFPSGPAEFNVKSDVAAMRKLLSECPVPVVMCGTDIGEALSYPASSIEKDFAWSTAHPVVDAYRAYKPMPYDAPAGEMAAVLYAVRPQENYFKLSETGTVAALDDGSLSFTPSPQGKHRYLIVDPAQKERITQVFTELASAKPVPRVPRFRQQQQQQQEQEKKPEPPKPAPAKTQ